MFSSTAQLFWCFLYFHPTDSFAALFRFFIFSNPSVLVLGIETPKEYFLNLSNSSTRRMSKFICPERRSRSPAFLSVKIITSWRPYTVLNFVAPASRPNHSSSIIISRLSPINPPDRILYVTTSLTDLLCSKQIQFSTCVDVITYLTSRSLIKVAALPHPPKHRA